MRRTIFILLVLILLAPLFFSAVKIDLIINIDRPLGGAYEEPKKPAISIANIFNGNFQNEFEKYFNYNLRGRATMSRIYNQIIYGLFKSTTNNILLTGKDGYLFEAGYPLTYLDEPAENQKQNLYDKMVTLASLQKTLERMGKYLFVIITPSKASIYPEHLPNDYHKYAMLKNGGGGGYSQNYYEYFISRAGDINLEYFDYHDEFLELKKNGIDIFSKGGTHWNGIAVAEYINSFINVINTKCGDKIGTIKKIKANPVWGNAFMTDNDLEILLNLIPPKGRILSKIFPRDRYYSYHMETLSIPTAYRPDVFVMGGSFNWTWLSMIYGTNGWVEHGEKAVFGETYMRYYDLFIQKYPENIRTSNTINDFQNVMDQDILIIELNEGAIFPEATQFAFAENLLDFIDMARN